MMGMELVQHVDGERFVVHEETDDGVVTDCGFFRWSEIEGGWRYDQQSGWQYIPNDRHV